MAGEAIPLGARIIAVADSLSAMLQDRPYRRGCTFDEAEGELRAGAGTAYDPRVVEAFLQARPMVVHWLRSLQPVADEEAGEGISADAAAV